MRNPGHLLLRSTLRSARPATLVVLLAVLLLAGSGTAVADDHVAREETTWAGFGMLGPVGLVAVVLGIIGMALGVLRQRRKARAAVTATAPAPAAAEAETDEPTRPLAPIRNP